MLLCAVPYTSAVACAGSAATSTFRSYLWWPHYPKGTNINFEYIGLKGLKPEWVGSMYMVGCTMSSPGPAELGRMLPLAQQLLL